MMQKVLKWGAALIFLGIASYILFVQAAPLLTPPCTTPVAYSIGTIDSRFGISEATLRVNLAKAAALWNEAAGKVVIVAAEDGDVPVSLVYSDEQRATELGKTIDAEQAAYDAQKDELAEMKDRYVAMKSSYQQKQRAYERRASRYQAEVARYNAEGGAPPSEYQRLQQEARDLEEEQDELNAEADKVNVYSAQINEEVEELNALAKKINAKVSTYNANAGEDFDQGNYESDREGKRITIYEYTDQTDLTRVLAHEFGHALGMDHVENPDSVMYSFNFGDDLELTAEDVTALKETCRLD